MNTAAHIKRYRDQHQLSQAGFARLIGVTQSLITHWENGRRRPGPRFARYIEEKTQGELTRADLRPDLFG